VNVHESWETWKALAELPEQYRDNAFDKFVIRLSTAERFYSIKDDDVPPEGTVSGGPDPTQI
jgi:hypothetical protein